MRKRTTRATTRTTTRTTTRSKKPVVRLKAKDLIKNVYLEDKADSEYYAYGLSVIEDRAISGSIDGLKPVMRRSLWSTHQLGLHSKAKADKSAKIVGNVLGNYHPHGDCLVGETPVYFLSGEVETIKSLSDRKAGRRWVLAYDEETNTAVPAIAHSWKVGHITKTTYKIYLSDGSHIECSSNHPFYVENEGWLTAENLEVSDSLVGGYLENSTYPTLKLNNVAKVAIHQLVGNHAIGPVEDCEVFHHVNENTKDNRPKNLNRVDRAEHASLHPENYALGLANGRQTMFSGSSNYRTAIRNKNSSLLSSYNEWQWLLKAIKIVNQLRDSDTELTKENYDIERLSLYNGTTRQRLEERGISFKKLLKLSRTFKLDTSASKGFTSGLNERAKRLRVKRNSLKDKKCITEQARKHRILAQSGRVLKRLAKDYYLDSCCWKDYEECRKLLCSFGEWGGGTSGRDFPKRSTILDTLHKRKLSLTGLIKTISPKHCLFISDIEIVEHNEDQVLYDFTVDKYANMLVPTKIDSEGNMTLVATHNTAAYEAIVNSANSPMPLIQGFGNFGTMTDPPAAYRYTNARLSRYADLVFFDKFYLPTIDYVPNYDGSREEPLVLPTLLPNSLLNGNFGIAPGVNTRTPSYTIASVLKVLRTSIKDRECTAKTCLGLEFTTKYGGVVNRRPKEVKAELLEFYRTGKGSVLVESTASAPNAHNEIRITRFAPLSNIFKTLAAVEAIKGVIGTRDDGDKSDTYKIAYVVSFAKNLKGALLAEVISKVMEKFSSRLTYSVAATDRILDSKGECSAKLFPTTVPNLLSLWIDYRIKLEVRACTYWIEKRKIEIADLHLLRLAVKMRDVILKALSLKITDKELAEHLAKRLKITVVQANRILDLKVRQLRSLEDEVLVEKISALEAESATYVERIRAPRSYILKQLRVLENALIPKL